MLMIRYVIEMENGKFLKTNYIDGIPEAEIEAMHSPIDGDLIEEYETAKRYLKEVLEGGSFLPVRYDKDNPPKRVIKMNIVFEKIEMGDD